MCYHKRILKKKKFQNVKFHLIFDIYICNRKNNKIMEYIDLGLKSGNLWASCNVGAEKPEDCGKYMNYFNLKNDEYEIIPSKEDFQELIDECTFEFIKQNDVKGCKIIGKNNNSIFLPTTNFIQPFGCKMNKCEFLEDFGMYWTSTECTFDVNYAVRFSIYFDDEYKMLTHQDKYNGYVVRLIQQKHK